MEDSRTKLLREYAEGMKYTTHGGKELADGITGMLDENRQLKEDVRLLKEHVRRLEEGRRED